MEIESLAPACRRKEDRNQSELQNMMHGLKAGQALIYKKSGVTVSDVLLNTERKYIIYTLVFPRHVAVIPI